MAVEPQESRVLTGMSLAKRDLAQGECSIVCTTDKGGSVHFNTRACGWHSCAVIPRAVYSVWLNATAKQGEPSGTPEELKDRMAGNRPVILSNKKPFTELI